MDQRVGHLQADRIRLLLEAAKATREYVAANPEPAEEIETEPEFIAPPATHASGK